MTKHLPIKLRAFRLKTLFPRILGLFVCLVAVGLLCGCLPKYNVSNHAFYKEGGTARIQVETAVGFEGTKVIIYPWTEYGQAYLANSIPRGKVDQRYTILARNRIFKNGAALFTGLSGGDFYVRCEGRRYIMLTPVDAIKLNGQVSMSMSYQGPDAGIKIFQTAFGELRLHEDGTWDPAVVRGWESHSWERVVSVDHDEQRVVVFP